MSLLLGRTAVCRLCAARCIVITTPAPAPKRSMSRVASLTSSPPARRPSYSTPPPPLGTTRTGDNKTTWQCRRMMTVKAQPPTAPSEDFEPVEDGHDTIELTEAAAKQIATAQRKASNPDLALRVAVESGGCHGYQYKMEVTPNRDADDYLFQPADSPARLLIDSSSLSLLSGSKIDYATELIGSSFRVSNNPHASDKGGCGCGVSWELKE